MPSPAILVVDNEDSVLITYRMLLERQGYNATAAPSCSAALELLREREFDLLLCDLALEGQRTGFEVFERARRRSPQVACILLTGYASPRALERAEREGVVVLQKPTEIEHLLATIDSLLARRQNGNGAAAVQE